MEKRSTHWADVLNWLQVVTDSCQTKEQAESCLRLIYNFERVYESKIGISQCLEYLRPFKHKCWEVGDFSFKEKVKKLI